jgi:capsular exopolysaccharide synthesis family protein
VYLARLAADPESPENLQAFKALQGSLTVKLRRATRLIDVTIEHSDPETAQLLANLLVQEYIQEGFGYQSGDYQNTSQFLTQEADRMKDKLQMAETQLQDYAKLVDLRQRILDERKELDLLNERYLEKHPKVIEAHALLADLQKQFIEEMERRKAADPQQAGGAAAATPDESNLTDDEKVEREMVEEQSHYNVLTQEEATERTMYESVLDRLKEAGISEGYQDANVRLVESARLPLIPAKPRIFLVQAIGLFLGVFTGVGFTFLLSSMDSSFRTIDEAEGRLNLPALGAIPELTPDVVGGNGQYQGGYRAKKWVDTLAVKERREAMLEEAKRKLPWKKEKEDQGIGLVIKDNRDSMVAEAIRSLRAAIKLQGRQEERKTLLLTSAVPAEGKSFITSNLATALAQEGSRVLLIDADLRKPTIHHIFGLPRMTAGVTDWLMGDKNFSELIVSVPGVSGLFLMPAGTPVPHPAELLSHGTLQKNLRKIVDQFDYVLVDSAPIHAVGDTLLICEFFQTTIMVIHAGKTPAQASIRAVRMLANAGAKVTGFILNRLPQQSGFGYNPYYYYYQSTDKYGEAYGTSAGQGQGVSPK